jgi:hypothetical protein
MTIVSRNGAKVELKEGPIEVRAQAVDDWNVAFERWPPGDYSPLFKGLPGDACGATHFGYCMKGKAEIVYSDRVETISAGDAYVVSPGHRFRVLETVEVAEFTEMTPTYAKVGEAFMKNFPAWLKANKQKLSAVR